MILTELTAIAGSDLPVDTLKEHLRLGTGFAEEDLQDGLCEAYLRAAIATIEGRVGLVLIPRAFMWQLTDWRNVDRQVLPVRPVTAVQSVLIFDRDGAQTAVDGDDFDFEPDVLSPAIAAARGALPDIPQGGVAEIAFEAGFGPDWSGVPSDLAQAVILLAAHFYEHRTGSLEGGGVLPMPVAALLERHRPLRLFGGI